MARTKVSSRGQVVLPASIPAGKGWGPGTELEVVDQGNGVFLRKRSRREELFPPITIEEFLARRPKYEGPPITDEQMREAILEEARRRWYDEESG